MKYRIDRHWRSGGTCAGIVVLLVLGSCGGPGSTDDYLSPELRARVAQLKKEAATSPTSAENLQARTDVLWDWANAYSFTGGPIPVNLPLDVTSIRMSQDAVSNWRQSETDGFEPPVKWLEQMDYYIEEFTLKDEHPEEIGELRVTSEAPLVSGQWATVEQIYTLGSRPMQAGGGFMVARQLSLGRDPFQVEDPAMGWYVSIRSSNPGARFQRFIRAMPGMHGGRSKNETPTFILEGSSLQPGDPVTVTYGDTSGGSPGFRVQTATTDELLFPLYIDLEGKGNFLTPVWPSLPVLGAKVHAVHGFVPSIVGVDEAFDVSARSEDRYLNRAGGSLPGYQVFLNDEPFGEIPAGDEAIHLLEGITIDTPGVYRFRFESADGSIRGSSDPIWVREEIENRIYWGETHGHTGFAEGQGSAEEFFRFGLEDSRLDFVCLSEHDIWLDDFEWQALKDLVIKYHQPGKFIPYLGYEWTLEIDRGGHHNVLFRTPEGRDMVAAQDANRLPLVYAGLHQANDPEDVLIIPHAHQSGNWAQNDPELEKLVEIYSQHGSFEWFGNMYLQRGHEVGFIGASDTHQAKPGYNSAMFHPSPNGQFSGLAAILAPEKTNDAIFDAMRGLSAYATSGQRIILQADLNGAGMGTWQPFTPDRVLVCRVMGTSPIDQIEVIKNGEVVYGQDFLSTPLNSRVWIQVAFESSSEVLGEEPDNPRPVRQWIGTLDVSGARIRSVLTPGFDNRHFEYAAIDGDSSNRIRFHSETRGRRDVMLVELDGAGGSTVFRFQTEARMELKYSRPVKRQPAQIPAADVRLRLGDLHGGRLSHEFQVGEHIDAIRLQAIDPEGSFDQAFRFTDLESPGQGDYYYIRVTQMDGGRAWSSPFWVGKEAGN